jgi:hypothetical protein
LRAEGGKSGIGEGGKGGFMFEGLFQPMHLIILLVFLVVVLGDVFLVFRVLWRLGSKLK